MSPDNDRYQPSPSENLLVEFTIPQKAEFWAARYQNANPCTYIDPSLGISVMSLTRVLREIQTNPHLEQMQTNNLAINSSFNVVNRVDVTLDPSESYIGMKYMYYSSSEKILREYDIFFYIEHENLVNVLVNGAPVGASQGSLDMNRLTTLVNFSTARLGVLASQNLAA